MHSAFTGVMPRPRRPLLLSLAEDDEETEEAEETDEELELTEEELEELLSARTITGTIRLLTRKKKKRWERIVN